MQEKKHELLMDSLQILTRIIGEMFGPNCEVLLHDLRDIDHSIVAIANGHVTGRHIGSPITNLGLFAVNSPNQENDEMINYAGTSPDGKPLKSSSAIFRAEDGTPIAAFCINLDLTEPMLIKSFFDSFYGTKPLENQEEYYPTMEQTFETLINKAIEMIHKPVAAMDKEDKKRIVALIDSWGAFLMKSSTEKVAEKLGVTRFTIYNYLEEIKNERSAP